MNKSKKMNLKNKKIIKSIAIIFIIIIFIYMAIYLYRINNYIEITQFAPNTSRQMMGYGILTKNNKIIIIDGGTTDDASQLLDYINNNGSVVEDWIITHPHSDHTGALKKIIEDTEIEIKNIYLSVEDEQWYKEYEPSRAEEVIDFLNTLSKEKMKDRVIEPKIGDIISVDNISGEVLGIKNPEITENAINNSSMVIKFKINNKSILFLGDTGVESSKKLIQNEEKKLKSDIVQVAHHGQNGATEDLYKIINPQICLWPTPQWLWDNNINGEEDSGQWKTKETREWMNNLKVKTNYIAKDGICKIRVY